jgi:hypothetical protein
MLMRFLNRLSGCTLTLFSGGGLDFDRSASLHGDAGRKRPGKDERFGEGPCHDDIRGRWSLARAPGGLYSVENTNQGYKLARLVSPWIIHHWRYGRSAVSAASMYTSRSSRRDQAGEDAG